MAAITTRAGKGSPLTNAELDSNFTNINDGITTAAAITGGTINGTSIGATTPSTGVFSEIDVDNLELNGNAIISTDTNGNIDLTPNGTGTVNVTKLSASSTFCLGTAAVLTSGKLSLQADLSAVNAMTLRDSGTTYGVSSYYTLYQNSAGSTVGGIGHTAVTSLGINATTDLQFFTAATERMRIGSSGNLGLGVTPSAWQTTSGSRAIQFLGSSLYGYRDTNLILAQNAYFDGSWRYYASSIASGYYTIGSGAHSWYTAPSGTAGNAISFTQAMTLDGSGNLGIGTTSPSDKLTVISAGTQVGSTNFRNISRIGLATNDASVLLGYNVGDGSGILSSTNNFPLAFWTSNAGTYAERMRIDSSGNLGLGVTSVLGRAQFNVSDTSTTILNSTVLYLSNTGAATTNQRIDLGFRWQDGTYNGNSAISAIRESGTARLTALAFCPSNSSGDPVEKMRIDSSGNVGIGTSSPTGKLNVVTDNTHNGGATFDSTGTTQVWMRDTDATANTRNWGFQISGGDFNILRANDDRATGFVTPVSFAQAPANSLIIDVSGNVGMGTASPNRTGFTAPVLSITNGTSGIIELIGTQTADGTIGQVAFYNTSSSVRIAQILGVRSGANNSGALTFQTNNAGTLGERARIDSSGNLLVGTTTPIYNTAGRGLITINGSSAAALGFTAGAVDKGIILHTGTDMIMSNSVSGAITFQTNNTERARIDSSGNVGIGETNPVAALHVSRLAAAAATNALAFTLTRPGTADSLLSYWSDAYSPNGASATLKLGSINATGRSINSTGTNNASGSDYAEYMTKCDDFVVAKGDVVGVNAEGKLTNVFADAVAFLVKSTNPSFVGGDSWGSDFEDNLEELEVARQAVDRIAFSGQVPVNVTGATAGQYIIPVNNNGAIKGQAVSNPTFEQYQIAVGKVIAIEADGRAKIIVKVA
jgi:uncharacterized protein YaiE (UPF0345 family)